MKVLLGLNREVPFRVLVSFSGCYFSGRTCCGLGPGPCDSPFLRTPRERAAPRTLE